MDNRPLKLLERAPDEHRSSLVALTNHAGALAEDAGVDLQFEFGKDTIAFIAGCNQFLRLHFKGDRAGTVSLPKTAGVTGTPAKEMVFKMFGWQTVDADAKLVDAVSLAFEEAAKSKPPA